MRFTQSLIFTLLICTNLCAAEETPPENIIENYQWSILPKYRPNTITRLEQFWKKYYPEKGEYEDSIHSRFVLLCAYKLSYLYAADGRLQESKKMLDFIQSTDPRLIQEERQAQQDAAANP